MKFPVIRTTVQVLEYCWLERRLLLRFAVPPFIIATLFAAAVLAMGLGEGQPQVLAVAVGFVQTLIFAPMTVTWYRIAVLGEDEAKNRALFTLGSREWRLIGWQIAALAVFGLIALACFSISVGLGAMDTPLTTILSVLWSITWVVAIVYAAMRLTIVMALVALDQPIHFKAIWNMTRGVTGRLFLCTFLLTLVSVLVGLMFKLVGFILDAAGAITTDGPLKTILAYFDLIGTTLVSALSVILTATLFAFIYKMLTAYALSNAQHPPAPEQPAQ